MFNSRLGCSSISFRHQDLPTALRTISGLGFEEIDLGALPGVCDHVPYDLDAGALAAVPAAGHVAAPVSMSSAVRARPRRSTLPVGPSGSVSRKRTARGSM